MSAKQTRRCRVFADPPMSAKASWPVSSPRDGPLAKRRPCARRGPLRAQMFPLTDAIVAMIDRLTDGQIGTQIGRDMDRCWGKWWRRRSKERNAASAKAWASGRERERGGAGVVADPRQRRRFRERRRHERPQGGPRPHPRHGRPARRRRAGLAGGAGRNLPGRPDGRQVRLSPPPPNLPTHTHTPNPTNPRAVTHSQRIPTSPLPMVRPPIRGNLGARRGHATRGVAAHLVARRGCSLKAWLLAPRAWLLA